MLDRAVDLRLGDWTPEREGLLTKRWAEGVSANLIAEELGGVSRSAVIGKVHRLKLEKRKTVNAVYRSGPVRYEERQRRIAERGSRKLLERLLRERIPAPKPQPALAPVMRRLSLMQLSAETCHFPVGNVGEPGFFFCGSDVRKGSSYCPFHHLVTH